MQVADCVLLMSLGKQNVVPVDTHIHSIAVLHYGQRKKSQLSATSYEEIASFFEQLWQPFAGWAQAVDKYVPLSERHSSSFSRRHSPTNFADLHH